MRFFLSIPFLVVAFVFAGLAMFVAAVAWVAGRLGKAIAGE